MSTTPPSPAPARSGLRLALDFGPLLLFFAANKIWGLLTATAVLIPTSVVAVLAVRKLEGRVPRATLYATGAVLVFGALTLALQDEELIKIKVTAINLLLAGILGIGLLRGTAALKFLFGEAFQLTEEGWRRLTARFALFFLCLAGLNEVLRRVLSSDDWVNFKVFGILALTVVFTVFQTPLLQKHALEQDEPSS
jgi:intracellular septation protein